MLLKESHKYDDIIDRQRPVSRNHAPMSMADRAAQFAPFAALTGYEAAVREHARLTGSRIELSEDSRILLDRKQRLLREHGAERPELSVTYFVPDERKDGGEYITVTGRYRGTDPVEKLLLMEDGTRIPVGEILTLEGGIFSGIL